MPCRVAGKASLACPRIFHRLLQLRSCPGEGCSLLQSPPREIPDLNTGPVSDRKGFPLEDSNMGRTRPVVVPGMTVLLTTTRWYASAPLIADPTSSAAFFTNVRLMDPS